VDAARAAERSRLTPPAFRPATRTPVVAAHQPGCCFIGRNEARFGRQADLGTSRIDAEPDNGLGESGLGEGQELLGRAEDDRLVAGETPETPDRAGEKFFGWPRAQQSGAAREVEHQRRVEGRHIESPSRRQAGQCAYELELA
jgi:hypothetical protein